MRKLKFVVVVCCLLALLAQTGCGGGGSGGEIAPTATPTATASPASQVSIRGDTAVVVTFSTSMDTASLLLSGTLAAESGGGSWSTVAVANDTLTVAPGTQWSNGAKTLMVNAQDVNGTAINELSLAYTVDATLPVASVSPASGSAIALGDTIVITYSKSMATTSLSASGTMWSEGDGGVWSTTTNTNDTLTVAPTSAWTSGAHTLNISADDSLGNNRTLTLSYSAAGPKPAATTLPASLASIKGDTAIVVSFSASMNTSSLVLGGTLASQSDGGVWTATSSANDTLTISPATQWTSGSKSLTVDASGASGTAIDSLSVTYAIDATLPVASVSPASGSTIALGDAIVITYSESMATNSLSGSGTMWSESDGGVWSTTSFTNDTLTISPASSWAVGTRTLNISADDSVGNSRTLNLSYTAAGPKPTATTLPASQASIKGDTAIVVSFSASMNTSSLALGGTLASQSDGGVWSATTSANDTLTISPTSQWTSGAKTLTVDASGASGTAIDSLSLTYAVDATLPVASVSPASGSTIALGDAIVITYSESMATNSLSGSGTMWSESDGGVWSTTTNANDTLTITPTSAWTTGAHTLDISADDLVGNNRAVNLSYSATSDVDGDGFAASVDCDDNNSAIHPGAAEVCDSIDNDCDGYTDNSAACVAGRSCTADAECVDGIACTEYRCIASQCTVTPSTFCDDGFYCDGAETCNPTDPLADSNGCVGGSALTCDDGNECTAGSCDEANNSCIHTPVADGTVCPDGACQNGTCILLQLPPP